MIKALTKRVAVYGYKNSWQWSGLGLATYRKYSVGTPQEYVSQRCTILGVGHCITDFLLGVGTSRTWSSTPGGGKMYLSNFNVTLRVGFVYITFSPYIHEED